MSCLDQKVNQHLRLFIVPYHAPYKPKHRYWTGLLLLVRIVVYIISAGTLSMDHTISIIAIGIATSILLMLSTNRPYKKRPIEVIEIISFTNIICLCLATVFLSKGGQGQDIVACISGSITFIMFLIVLSYHILTELCFKTKFGKAFKQKFRRHEDTEEYESKQEEKDERMPLTFSEVPAPRGDSDRADSELSTVALLQLCQRQTPTCIPETLWLRPTQVHASVSSSVIIPLLFSFLDRVWET